MNTAPVNIADKMIPTAKPAVGMAKHASLPIANAAMNGEPTQANSLQAMIAKLLQGSGIGEKPAKKADSVVTTDNVATILPPSTDTDTSQLLAMSQLASFNNVVAAQPAAIAASAGGDILGDSAGPNGGTLKTAVQAINTGIDTQAIGTVAARATAAAPTADITAPNAASNAAPNGQAADTVAAAGTIANAVPATGVTQAAVKTDQAAGAVLQADPEPQAMAEVAKAAISPLPAEAAASQSSKEKGSSKATDNSTTHQQAGQAVAPAQLNLSNAVRDKAIPVQGVTKPQPAKPGPMQAALAGIADAQGTKETASQTINPPPAQGPLAISGPVVQATVPPAPAATHAEGMAQVVNQITDAAVANAASLGQQIVIRLNPPSLGEVKLTLSAIGQDVQGTIQVQNPDTYHQIRVEADQLVSRLADNGIHLRRMDVVLSDPSPQLGQDQHLYRDGSRGQDQQAFAQSQQQSPSDRDGRSASAGEETLAQETGELDASPTASAADAAGPVASDGALNVWM